MFGLLGGIAFRESRATVPGMDERLGSVRAAARERQRTSKRGRPATAGSGVQLGSGRPALPAEARRTSKVPIMLRAQEARDLRTIAEAWGVPVGTVAWSLVSDRLAELRRVALDCGPSGLARAAAAYLVRRAQGVPPPAALDQVALEVDANSR